MGEEIFSVKAARSTAASMWGALIQASLPNSWVKVPTKRALVQAVIASIHAILSSQLAANISIESVARTAELLGLPWDEVAPRPGEDPREWFGRLVRRREDETATEWLDRAIKVSMALLAHIRGLSVSLDQLMGMLTGHSGADLADVL